ncbi:MAG: MFS transporter [Coxiellaceae bacterium]|nr:MFS transporter [Coxiellaceae bacterium]
MHHVEKKIKAIGIFIWVIAATFFLYEFFLRTFVGSIAHQLISDLQLDIEQFTLISSAYYVAYGLMQIPVGILADKFGVKKIMIFAILTCALSTFLFAHSQSFSQALLGRFFMGFGSSFAFVCLLVIASNWFPRRLFGFFAGASQFIGTMGPALAGGPLISWLMASHISWRLALSRIGAFGVVLALLAFIFVKNKPRDGENTLLFLSKNEPIMVRLRRLLKTKQAWAIAVYSASVYVAIAVMAAVWGTDYLEAVGLSQKTAAYMLTTAWLAYAVGCPLLGFLSDWSKRRKPFLILCAVLGLISMSLILYGHFASKIAYEILFSMLGLAATGQNIGFAAIAEHTNPDTKATALGLNNGLITLSGAILPLAIGQLIALSDGGNNAQHVSLHAFIYGLSLLPMAYFISLITSVFLIKETYCKPQKGLIMLRRHSSE